MPSAARHFGFWILDFGFWSESKIGNPKSKMLRQRWLAVDDHRLDGLDARAAARLHQRRRAAEADQRLEVLQRRKNEREVVAHRPLDGLGGIDPGDVDRLALVGGGDDVAANDGEKKVGV